MQIAPIDPTNFAEVINTFSLSFTELNLFIALSLLCIGLLIQLRSPQKLLASTLTALLITCISILALAANFFSQFILFELISFISLILGYTSNHPLKAKNSYIAFASSQFAALLFFLGMTLINDYNSTLIHILVLLAFMIKLGIYPFDFWIKKYYQILPYELCAVFSALKSTITYIIFFQIANKFFFNDLNILVLIIILGLVSALIASFDALKEHDSRRFLALSKIENFSLLILEMALYFIFKYYHLYDLAFVLLIVIVTHLSSQMLAKSLLITNLAKRENYGPSESDIWIAGFSILSLAAVFGTAGFNFKYLLLQQLLASLKQDIPLLDSLVCVSIFLIALISATTLINYFRFFALTYLQKEIRVSTSEPFLSKLASVILLLLFLSLTLMSLNYSAQISSIIIPVSVVIFGFLLVYLIMQIFTKSHTKEAEKLWACGFQGEMELGLKHFSLIQNIARLLRPYYGIKNQLSFAGYLLRKQKSMMEI